MFNPDTRKFENLMSSSIVSQTAATAAAIASLNAAASLNVASFNAAAHTHNQSSEWYNQMRWNCINLLNAARSLSLPPHASTNDFMHWNLDDDDEDDNDDDVDISQHFW